MKIALKKSNQKVNIFNLGHNNYINVNKSVKIIEKFMDLKPKNFTLEENQAGLEIYLLFFR